MVAVASAGPYASHVQLAALVKLNIAFSSCHPTNSVKAKVSDAKKIMEKANSHRHLQVKFPYFWKDHDCVIADQTLEH